MEFYFHVFFSSLVSSKFCNIIVTSFLGQIGALDLIKNKQCNSRPAINMRLYVSHLVYTVIERAESLVMWAVDEKKTFIVLMARKGN